MGTQELKYKAVYNWVLENINSGALKVGEKLPSENELSERFGLSRQTVRHAVDILEQQKLVLRVRGSGTYVGGNGKAERQERYMNIAVISTYVDSYIFPPVVRGIERVLSKKGYTTQIAFTGNRVSREQDILNNLIDKDIIDGLWSRPKAPSPIQICITTRSLRNGESRSCSSTAGIRIWSCPACP